MKKTVTLVLSVFIAMQCFAGLITQVNLEEGTVTIYNPGTTPIDISFHQLTINDNVVNVSDGTVVLGSTTISPDNDVTIQFTSELLHQVDGSVALWLPGTFNGSPTSNDIIDFVEWGNLSLPTSIFRNIANQAGLWESENFQIVVVGDNQINEVLNRINNDPNDTGVNVWSQLSSIGPYQYGNNQIDITVSPNPSQDFIHLTCTLDHGANDRQMVVLDATGKLVYRQAVRSELTILSISDWKPGVYLIMMETEDTLIGSERLVKL